MTVQRVVQALSLALFVCPLLRLARQLLPLWPADGFLRMDPIICLGTLAADRQWVPLLWIAALIGLLSLFLGRFFCAYMCPMGGIIDFSDALLRTRRKGLRKTRADAPAAGPSKLIKYRVLVFILGAAAFGISFVFIASPLSLVTRLVGMIGHPVLAFLGDRGLYVLRPAAEALDLPLLTYAVVKVPRYDLQWANLMVWMAIIAGGLWVPRFWCRCLCPAGAVLAIFSRRPLFRRQVARDCNGCKQCIRRCPMGAIGTEPFITDHSECITCLACIRACPTGSISFTPGHKRRSLQNLSAGRRRLLGACLSGAAAAIVTRTGLKSPQADPGPGRIVVPGLIRPPGAVPESEFLTRCVRCGECMFACPTNSLQPLGLAAGVSALFSPVVTPRRGPCEPTCIACGHACPTRAILPLPANERPYAKIGTARIVRHKCLAWELEKKCLICDEVCPFDAIEFRKLADMPVAVPFVREYKCAGCGYCEHHCPVQALPAIQVGPMQALRLSAGSYPATARQRGFLLEIDNYDGRKLSNFNRLDQGAPGPTETKGLPPGFTDLEK